MAAIEEQRKIIVKGVSFWYGRNRILDRVDADFSEHAVTAIMGPSGQGKTTMLGLFNHMWDAVSGAKMTGEIRIRIGGGWVSPTAADIPLPLLRRKVAMIFQEPNPLPMSIARNMAFPLKLAGVRDRPAVRARVQDALEQACLWDEVKDRMDESALSLSGGQRQRLCVARALVLEPEILLCDEPTSSLDARAAGGIEDLLVSLKARCTLLVVSHCREQVRRIADRVLLLADGRLSPVWADEKDGVG